MSSVAIVGSQVFEMGRIRMARSIDSIHNLCEAKLLLRSVIIIHYSSRTSCFNFVLAPKKNIKIIIIIQLISDRKKKLNRSIFYAPFHFKNMAEGPILKLRYCFIEAKSLK